MKNPRKYPKFIKLVLIQSKTQVLDKISEILLIQLKHNQPFIDNENSNNNAIPLER